MSNEFNVEEINENINFKVDEIYVNYIENGSITEEKLSYDLKQKINNPINGIENGSITPEKTNFLESNALYENELLTFEYKNTTSWASQKIRIDNIKPNALYTCFIEKVSGTVAESCPIIILEFDSSGTQIKQTNSKEIYENVELVITTQANTSYITLGFHASSGTAGNGTAIFENIVFVEGKEKEVEFKENIYAKVKDNSITRNKIVNGEITLLKLEEKLVAGIENMSELADITNTSTILTKFINKNGVFETYDTYSCRELSISGGEIFYLTGTSSTNMPLYAFYNDDTLLSCCPRRSK